MKKRRLFVIFTIIILFVSCSFDSDYGYCPETQFNPSIDELKESKIPIVEINVENGVAVASKEIWLNASLKITGDFCLQENFERADIKIKGRGNSSWDLPKKPYAIKLSSKEKILGFPKSKKWVLIANYSDKTLLRNYFVSILGVNLYNSVWNPSFKSVNLVVNGEYRGVYLIGESIKIDKNRVNIADLSECDGNDGGFIFEVNQRLDENLNFITDRNVCISLKDPDELPAEKWNFIKGAIQSAENILFSENFNDEESGYAKYFDVDSVIDWYIMNELGKNVDSANFSSIYFYYDNSDGLFHMEPNWDFDLAFGNANYYGCDSFEGLYVKENSVWIKRMFEDPSFVKKMVQSLFLCD